VTPPYRRIWTTKAGARRVGWMVEFHEMGARRRRMFFKRENAEGFFRELSIKTSGGEAAYE